MPNIAELIVNFRAGDTSGLDVLGTITVSIEQLTAAGSGIAEVEGQLTALNGTATATGAALSSAGEGATTFTASVSSAIDPTGQLAQQQTAVAASSDAMTASEAANAEATTAAGSAAEASTGQFIGYNDALEREQAVAMAATAANTDFSSSFEAVTSGAAATDGAVIGLSASIERLTLADIAALGAAENLAAVQATLTAEYEGMAAASATLGGAQQATALTAEEETAIFRTLNEVEQQGILTADMLAASQRMLAEAQTMTAQADAAAIASKRELALAQKDANAATDQSLSSLGAQNSSLVLGAAAAGIFTAASTVMFTNFEAAMSKSESFAGVAHDEMAQLSEDMLNVSRASGDSATNVADGLYLAESAGFRASDAMNIVAASANLAQAAMTDTKTVVNATTTALNAYGLSADQTTHVQDVMTATVTAGKMQFADYALNIGKAAPLAAEFGISLEQMGASIATMTDKGLSAALATQYFRSEMQALEKPTAGAQAVLASLGLSVASVRQEIADKGFLATLSDLRGRLNGNVDALEALFPNFRALVGVLSDTGSSLTDYQSKLDSITMSSGASAHANEVWAATTEASVKKTVSTLKADMIEFGAGVATALKPAMDAFVQFDQAMHSMFGAGGSGGKGGGNFFTDFMHDVETESGNVIGKMVQEIPEVEAFWRAVNNGGKLPDAPKQAAITFDGFTKSLDSTTAAGGAYNYGLQQTETTQQKAVETAQTYIEQLKAVEKADKAVETASDALTKADRESTIARMESVDKYIPALQKEATETDKFGKAIQDLHVASGQAIDPVMDSALKNLATDSDAAKEALDAFTKAKALAMAPSPAAAEGTNQLKLLNAELLIDEQNMLNVKEGTDKTAQAQQHYADSAKEIATSLQPAIDHQTELNKVNDAASGYIQAIGKSMLDGTLSTEGYNAKVQELENHFATGVPPAVAETINSMADAKDAQTKAGESAQRLSDDIHSIAEAFGVVPADASPAQEAISNIGTKAGDMSTAVQKAATETNTAITSIGTQGNATVTDVGTSLKTISTGLDSVATNATTNATTINTALTFISVAALNAQTVAGTAADTINAAYQTIADKATSVHVAVDAQLGTLGADDIGPAGANGQAIGVALDAGIISGVMSAAGEVATAAAAVVTGAIAAAKAAAAISSPSGVTAEEIGVPLGQGVAVGLDSTKDQVAQAGTDVVNFGYEAMIEASKPGKPGHRDLLAEQGDIADTIWGTNGPVQQAAKKGGRAAGEGHVTSAAEGIKAKKSVFVDQMLDLYDAMIAYGLGSKEGEAAAKGYIDGITTYYKAHKEEAQLTKEGNAIDSGRLPSDHSVFSPEDIANLREEAAQAAGEFEQLAAKAHTAWAQVSTDIETLMAAVGVDAQKAAQEQLDVDTGFATSLTSLSHDRYTIWHDDLTAISADEATAAKASLDAWKDSLTAQQELYKDDKIERHLLNKDTGDDYKEMTQDQMHSDVTFRESQRSNALTALATTKDLDQQMADAAQAVQDNIGKAGEKEARDNYARIKGQDDAWRAYTQDLSSRFDDASTVVQNDLKAMDKQEKDLEKTAKDTATAQTAAESDLHTARTRNIDDEKKQTDRQISDEERAIKNESDAQKEWFRKKKEILDDYNEAVKRAEDDRHTAEDRAIKKQETDSIAALTKALQAQTDYTKQVIGNINQTTTAAYGLGQAFAGTTSGGSSAGPLPGVAGSIGQATTSVTQVADEFHTATAHFDTTVDEFHTSIMKLDGQVSGDGGTTLPQAAQTLENASGNNGGLGTAVSEFRTATGPDGLNGAAHIVRDAGQEFAHIPGQLRVGSDGLIHADASLEAAANGHSQVNEHMHTGAVATVQGGLDTSAAANGPLTTGGLDLSAAAKKMQADLAALGKMPGSDPAKAAGGGGGGGDGSGEHGEGGSPPKGGDLRDALIKAGDLNGTNAAIAASTQADFYAKTAAANEKASQDQIAANKKLIADPTDANSKATTDNTTAVKNLTTAVNTSSSSGGGGGGGSSGGGSSSSGAGGVGSYFAGNDSAPPGLIIGQYGDDKTGTTELFTSPGASQAQLEAGYKQSITYTPPTSSAPGAFGGFGASVGAFGGSTIPDQGMGDAAGALLTTVTTMNVATAALNTTAAALKEVAQQTNQTTILFDSKVVAQSMNRGMTRSLIMLGRV